MATKKTLEVVFEKGYEPAVQLKSKGSLVPGGRQSHSTSG